MKRNTQTVSEGNKPATTKGRRGGPQPGSGRPTKFNQEVADRIVTLLRAGNYVETAAAAAGLSQVTVREWIKVGRRDGKGPLFEFAERVEKAQAESEAMDVNKLLQHGQRDWRALAWRLERRFPGRWREVTEKKVEQSGPGGGPIQHASVVKYELHVPANPMVQEDESGDD